MSPSRKADVQGYTDILGVPIDKKATLNYINHLRKQRILQSRNFEYGL